LQNAKKKHNKAARTLFYTPIKVSQKRSDELKMQKRFLLQQRFPNFLGNHAGHGTRRRISRGRKK